MNEQNSLLQNNTQVKKPDCLEPCPRKIHWWKWIVGFFSIIFIIMGLFAWGMDTYSQLQ